MPRVASEESELALAAVCCTSSSSREPSHLTVPQVISGDMTPQEAAKKYGQCARNIRKRAQTLTPKLAAAEKSLETPVSLLLGKRKRALETETKQKRVSHQPSRSKG